MGMTMNGLRDARDRAGLTIEEVAIRTRTLPDRITRWESGAETPDTDMLYALSKLYGTPPHRLLLTQSQDADGKGGALNADELGVMPALDAFRRELTAMRAVDLLPLDEETIDYCVGKMRDRLTLDKTQNK